MKWLGVFGFSILVVGCGPQDGVGELFEAYTMQCPTTTLEGVDVSHYDGAVDWSQLKSSGRAFGIAKATEGTGVVDAPAPKAEKPKTTKPRGR